MGSAALSVAGAARPEVLGAPRRAGALRRVFHGAAYRARLLAASQWFAAPALVFLAVLGIMYADPAGPLLLLATHAASANSAVTLAAALLAGTGAVLIGLTAYLAARSL